MEENETESTSLESFVSVELKLAARGADLWLALEAAQFASMLVREGLETDEQTAATDDFGQTFSGYTEDWEDASAQNRSAILEALGAHMEALRKQGLRVHWAVIEQGQESDDPDDPPIPLAIVSITTDSSPTIHVAVPDDLHIPTDDWD
ncbi:MAG: hypothetical protein KIT00_03800 [Rhodospirillales bacterium]|nr:hypothetical protein [Rhodospirillales bacterium]